LRGELIMKNLPASVMSPDQVVASGGNENPWAIRNPLDEARDLHRMVTQGSCTVGSIRDLISVPPEIESALRAYADRFPKDGQRIHCVLRFRERVAHEFERLVQLDLSFADPTPAQTEEHVSEVSVN